jgi:secretion/DNA translocation related TadE-like protein
MRDDEGVGSILTIAIGFVLVAALLGVGALFQVHSARARATAAADAAALAGAQQLLEGSAVACARAFDLARRNGALLTSCDAQDSDVQVSVAVPLHGALARFGAIRARSRARLTWH